MALPNLTNQNIQDTYQRVVQTDGTKIYDGTGSLLPLEFDGNNVIISGSLTAQTYVVSESIVAVTSGSTMFGNSSDDTHTFEGAITASGDISSSGDIFADSFRIQGNRAITLNASDVVTIAGDSTSTGVQFGKHDGTIRNYTFDGNITASGDISASGDLYGDNLAINNTIAHDGNILYLNGIQSLRNSANRLFIDSGEAYDSVTVLNNFTASGNITASTINTSDYQIQGKGLASFSSNTLQHGFDSSLTKYTYGKDSNNEHLFYGNITASGNISSSGVVIGEHVVIGTAGSAVGHISSSGNQLIGFEQNDSSRKVWKLSGTSTGGTISVYNTDSEQVKISPMTGIYFDSNLVGVSIGTTTSAEPDCLFLAGTGHITASGNISASGISHTFGGDLTIKDDLFVGDDTTINGDLITFYPDGGTGPTLRLKDATNDFFTDINQDNSFHIDCSYHAAMNFAISTNKFDTGTTVDFVATTANSHIFLDGGTGETVIKGTPIYFGNDTDASTAVFNGHITSSANISASGTVFGITGSFPHIITDGDTIEFRNKSTRAVEGFLKFDTTEGLQVLDDSKNTKPNKPGLTLFRTGSHETAGTTAEGDIVRFGNSTTVAGDIYALLPDGTWTQADRRENTSTCSLAAAVGTNSTTHGMLLRGMVKLDHDPGCLVGHPVYLGTTGHGNNSSADSGMYARVIGSYMSGSGTIYFNPDNAWVLRS